MAKIKDDCEHEITSIKMINNQEVEKEDEEAFKGGGGPEVPDQHQNYHHQIKTREGMKTA